MSRKGDRKPAARDAVRTPETTAPPYGWAASATVAVLLLYVVTLAPTTAFWDTSEYIATAHMLGIPHAPGNPLFLVLLDGALGDRSIYFASQDTAESFGVGDQVVRQGLLFNLPSGGVTPTDLPEGVVAIPPTVPIYPITGPYVDVPRTEQLLEEVFRYRGGLPDNQRWPDRTVGINGFYARAYWALAQAAFQAEDEPAVERFVERAQLWETLGT